MLPSAIPKDDPNRMTQDSIIDHMPGVWNRKSALSAAQSGRADTRLRLNQRKSTLDPFAHEPCADGILFSDARECCVIRLKRAARPFKRLACGAVHAQTRSARSPRVVRRRWKSFHGAPHRTRPPGIRALPTRKNRSHRAIRSAEFARACVRHSGQASSDGAVGWG